MPLNENCQHENLVRAKDREPGVYECLACGECFVAHDDDCLSNMEFGDIFGWIIIAFLVGLMLGIPF
jgi:hypothetical protein